MPRPHAALLQLPLVLAACTTRQARPQHGQAGNQRTIQAPYFAGSANAPFHLDGSGVLIRYTDRAQGSQAQRDADAKAFDAQLLAQRGSRAAFGGFSTNFPDRVLTFDGLTGHNLFSIHCQGHCKDLVLRVRGQAGRAVAAVARGDMAFPIVEVVEPTFYATSVSFEIERSRSDLGHWSEFSITRWAGQFWHTQPTPVAR